MRFLVWAAVVPSILVPASQPATWTNLPACPSIEPAKAGLAVAMSRENPIQKIRRDMCLTFLCRCSVDEFQGHSDKNWHEARPDQPVIVARHAAIVFRQANPHEIADLQI